jgi:hypothetical protein
LPVFQVSKSIIAISSEILKSKISELTDKQEDKLVIDEFKADVVQNMLKFAYNEKVELGKNMEFIEELLNAAGTYGVNKLKVAYFKYHLLLPFSPAVKPFLSPILTIQLLVAIWESPRSTNVWNCKKKRFFTCVPSTKNSTNAKNFRNC